MKKEALALIGSIALVVFLAGCTQTAKVESTESAEPAAIESEAQEAASTSNEVLRSYTVARIDGESDWNAVAVLDIDNQQWLDPVNISAHAQLCYDDEALYVRMWAEEADIRAEYPADDPLAPTRTAAWSSSSRRCRGMRAI